MKYFFIFLILALIMTAIRIPFIDEPFERDEGGYAYLGQNILEGRILYRDVWELMMPGLTYIHAGIFRLYGVNFYSIRIFTIFWALIGLLFFFLTADLLFGRKTAVLSGFFYAIFSGLPVIHGAGSNTEPFMIVFLIISLYFFALFMERGNTPLLFLSGLFAGAAVIVKQPAVLNLLSLILCIFLFPVNRKNSRFFILFIFIIGSLVPCSFFIYQFTKYGLWNGFFYAVSGWNFRYNQSFLAEGFFYRLLRSFIFISRENLILWLLSLSSVIFMLVNARSRKNILLLIWTAASFFGVCAGGLFYPHYYIQLIPALCMLSGFCVSNIFAGVNVKYFFRSIQTIFFAVTITICLALFAFSEYKYFFVYTPNQVSAAKYSTDIFVFARDFSRYIKYNTNEDDYIFIWGTEPEIYFYSRRRCPSRFIHNYCLTGTDDFAVNGRGEIMEQIALKKPVFIIPFSSMDNFPELKEYISGNYTASEYKGFVFYKSRAR